MYGVEIVRIAQKYIGQTEKTGNAGFKDADFERRMKEVGFAPGQSWCSYFCELVWKEAYAGHDIAAKLDKLFSGSATATFRQFDVDKTFPTGKLAKPGALAVWRHGTGWQGHIGIVSSVNNDTFKSIEGNTNDKGGREGYIVAEKTRKEKEPFKPNGLNLIGFVYPI